MQSYKNCRWWKEGDNEAHGPLFALADYLRDSQSWSTGADRYHAKMYAGARSECWDLPSTEDLEYDGSKLARNVARSAVDTYVAKVFKHRPLPEVLANQGSWKDQRRAKKMSQLVDGEFDKHKIFKRWARAIGRDAGVWGRGVLKIDIDHTDAKTIRCERIHPEELYVDPADAKYGSPRNIYHIDDRDQGLVIETFAADDEELAAKIEDAGKQDSMVKVRDLDMHTVDRVRIVESWHLCENEEAHSTDGEPLEHECTGRHVVAVRGATLVDEVWGFPRFPFAVLNYLEPLKGYFGTGLCEQLEGFHHEQNLMSEKVSDGHYYVGGGILYLENGGDVIEEDFTNSTGVKIVRGAPGGVPQFFNPEPVHPATYAYLRDINGDALNDVGLSEMSSSGSKEPGLTAAVAINAVDNIQSERLSMQGYGYAEWCCDVAELFIMWIRHISKKHEYTTRVPMKTGFLKLSWKDVVIDSYIVQVKNSALMRMSPAARRQMAQDMFDRGQLDSLEYMRVVESTDIGTELDVRTAMRVLTDEQIESMLDAKDPSDPNAYKPPSPYTNDFTWSKQRGQHRLAEAIIAGCDEENLDLVRDFIIDCESLEAKANGAAAGPVAGAPPPPPGAGAPPPLPDAGMPDMPLVA